MSLKKYCFLLFVLLSFAGTSRAYTRIKSAASPFNSPTWPSVPVPYWINDRGLSQILNGSEFNAIHAAFQTWESVSTAQIRFDYKGTTEQRGLARDGINLITFADDATQSILGSSTIAATFSFFTNNTTVIEEADIVFSQSFSFSTSGEAGKYDIQSVLTHEIGHFVGLDHSGLVSSVMVPFAALGQLEQRTLAYDDIAGVSEIYPRAVTGFAPGTIRGSVIAGTAPVFGAHVVALDATGTPLVSTLSLRNGSYSIRGLPAGSYRIYAEPLDLPVAAQNIGGYYNTLTTNFGTTFAGGTITVDAGAEAIANILAAPASSTGLNPTRPDSAVRMSRGVSGTLRNTGGQDIVPPLTVSTSSDVIVLGAQTFRTQSGSTAPTLVDVEITIPTFTPLGPKNIAVTRGAETSIVSGGIVIVDPQPSGITVSPNAGPTAGGTVITISGTNFRSGARVAIDGLPATDVRVLSSTSIKATTPRDVPGSANVVVINSDGTYGVATGAFTFSSNFDSTPPARPLVTDTGATTRRLTELSASWTAEDPESGIAEFRYAIGRTPGGEDIRTFTTIIENSVTVTGLQLEVGSTYYFSVQAINGAGLASEIGVSDGIRIEPSVQTYFKWIPWSPQNSSEFTGVALLAPVDMSIVIRALNANGTLASGARARNPVTITLSAGQEYARLIEELVGLDVFDGWIELEASAPGLGVYVTTGTWDLKQLDGSVPREPSADFVLFHPGAEAVLANPSPRVASVTIELLGGGSPQTVTIPPRSVLRTIIPGAVHIRSSEPLAAIDRFSSAVGPGKLGIGSPENAALPPSTLVFPQAVTGGGYTSTVTLANATNTPSNLTLSFAGASKSFQLEARSVLRVSLNTFLNLPISALTRGPVRVTPQSSSTTTGSVVGTLEIENAFSLLSLGAPPAAMQVTFPHVAHGDGYDTGLAIVAGSRAATVTVDVYPSSGTGPKSATFTIEANQQVSRFISELVPSVTRQMGGYIQIRSDQPIWAWEIYVSDQSMASAPPLYNQPLAKTQENTLFAFNFEDGRRPGPDIAYRTKKPAEILTESNGNHFLRMYASPEDSGNDGGPPFFTTAPTVRSELLIGSMDWSKYNPVTVSFSMRIHSENTPVANILAQFYQGGSNSGWVASVWADHGQFGVTGKDGADFEGRNDLYLGSIVRDQWITMAITVQFSPDIGGGKIGVTMNGKDMGTVSGRTLKNTTDPMSFFLNLYGDPVVPYSMIDYDNLLIQSWTAPAPAANE